MNLFIAFTVLEHTNAPKAKYAMPAERVYSMTPAVRAVTMTLDCPTLAHPSLKTGKPYMFKYIVASRCDGTENGRHCLDNIWIGTESKFSQVRNYTSREFLPARLHSSSRAIDNV